MKVKELIEKLEKFDGELEVQYDYDGQYSTMPIDEISIQNEHYIDSKKEVVVLF